MRTFFSSLFRLGLWFFGLSVLLGFFMRWWPGDRFLPVRFINYFMPWFLLGLLPALFAALLTKHKWLAATLSAPTLFIMLTYLPLFLNCSPAAVADGVPLKVMSYNVWRNNPDMAAVAGVIRSEKPDILLLQEIKPGSFQELASRLTDLYPEDRLQLAYAPHILQAVVSRYPLTPLEASPQKDRAQKVQLQTPFGRIIVINIHAYNFGWLRRHRQMTRLLKEDIATAKDPLILGGDFNTSDQTQTYRMVNRYLQNAHWQAGCGFGFTYPSSHSKFNRILSFPALIRIDHIFCSRRFVPRIYHRR
jgi:vancomycin resistance protein VanJ